MQAGVQAGAWEGARAGAQAAARKGSQRAPAMETIQAGLGVTADTKICRVRRNGHTD